MGKRRPERLPIQIRYQSSKTVVLMIANNWSVVSCCQVCKVKQHVNLENIARLRGPDYTMWNRKTRCRVLLCNGIVEFLGKATDMISYERLAIDPKEPL